jgi:ATPase subunit of ABC transporter with duplicated ATPase domains
MLLIRLGSGINHDIDLKKCHQYLSMFGLEPIHHSTKIVALSGGQKARVQFASFGIMRPHLLILDEPTNHLDITAINSLINALNGFTGAIILVTHNFDVITRLNVELWTVENKTLCKYPHDYAK